MTTRGLVSMKGLRPGRADEAGPSLAQDVEEAFAGKGQAQSSVPTFFKRREYIFCTQPSFSLCGTKETSSK